MSAVRARNVDPNRGGRAATVLVAGLGAAFGVALVQLTGALSVLIEGTGAAARHDSTPVLLGILAVVFTVIALYVAGVVIANTVATVVAGRTRTIALRRLLGASARSERSRVVREGLLAGVAGGAIGLVAGSLAAWAMVRIAVLAGWFPHDPRYDWIAPVALLPALAAIAATALAARVGSRRVLRVSPLEALSAAGEPSREELSRSRARTVVATALMIAGAILLVAGVAIGAFSPLGVLVGLVGGLLSFSGVIAGAHLILPVALRLVGRALGRSVPARLAAENAVRYPERATRSTIGLVIGVTLVVMFATATATFRVLVDAARTAQPETYAGIGQVLDALTATFSVLVGFSALIAAVGLVNSLSLSVLQRRRELGVLRAVGLAVRQLRTMILAESAQLTAAALLVGIVLGTVYGWCGAQSLLGSFSGVPRLIAPGVPWLTLVAVCGAAAVLTVVAAVVPARRATRVPPVEALAVE